MMVPVAQVAMMIMVGVVMMEETEDEGMQKTP